MNKLLITLDTDIKRCENTLKLNDYLEIVIVIEETIDKYKNQIEDINIGSDRIWNYSRKDLENILEKLKLERDKLINNYIESKIEKTNKLDYIYNKIINEIEDKDILDIVEEIYNIGKENENKTKKWDNLKKYMNKISEKELFDASKIILLINTIINN